MKKLITVKLILVQNILQIHEKFVLFIIDMFHKGFERLLQFCGYIKFCSICDLISFDFT